MLDGLEETQLGTRPDKVVFRILHLIISVTVNVVHQEPQDLLVCDVTGRERQPLALGIRKEISGPGQISAKKSIVHLAAHGNSVRLRIVLGTGIGIRAYGVTEII